MFQIIILFQKATIRKYFELKLNMKKSEILFCSFLSVFSIWFDQRKSLNAFISRCNRHMRFKQNEIADKSGCNYNFLQIITNNEYLTNKITNWIFWCSIHRVIQCNIQIIIYYLHNDSIVNSVYDSITTSDFLHMLNKGNILETKQYQLIITTLQRLR